MRKIGVDAIRVFFLLIGVVFVCSIVPMFLFFGKEFFVLLQFLTMFSLWFVVFLCVLIVVYRLFLLVVSFEGEIPVGSRKEVAAFVHQLFQIIFFEFLTYSKIFPYPFTRLIYIAFGARIGKNTYPTGKLCDCCFLEIGSNTIVGAGSVITPHIMEKDRLAFHRISIGSNVTIGINAVVLPGTVIGDGATVAAGAVVPKFSKIGAGEIWAGLPARRIKDSPVHAGT